jgi:hypothetical protein
VNATSSTTGVTLVQAAQLLAAHLADHGLPQPASLTVTTTDRCSEVTAQLDSLTMPMVALELLAWADTPNRHREPGCLRRRRPQPGSDR